MVFKGSAGCIKAISSRYLACRCHGRHFVPNISMGVPLVESLRKHSDFSLDVHLMIANPERFIETFREAGAIF